MIRPSKDWRSTAEALNGGGHISPILFPEKKIWYERRRRSTEERKRTDMRAEPIGQCLRTACFRVGVAGAAEHRDEDLRLADLDHLGGLVCVVDAALRDARNASPVGGAQEGTEVIAERAVLQAVRMLGFVFLPQQQPCYAKPRQLSLDVCEVRQGDIRRRLFLRIQTGGWSNRQARCNLVMTQ